MISKRYFNIFVLAATLGILTSLWIFALAQAQSGPIDAFTYFIPYPYDVLNDQFDAAQNTYPDLTNANVNTLVSIAVDRDNTTIIYDHYEDGLEADISAPTQASTEIFNQDAGDVLLLNDIVPGACNPTPTNFCYDGGDALTAVGGTISVVLTAFPMIATAPDSRPGVWFAGAWELYPTIRWGTDYIIPVGQDVPRLNNGFGVVGLNVQAVQDGTTVDLDLNGDGTFEETGLPLSYGGQLTRITGVNAGAQVRASAPVQVHIFTGDPDETGELYEARAYSMVPFNDWQSDYLAPRASDGDFWLYNPDSTDLIVTAQTESGSTDITIPGPGFARYPTTAGLSGATGVRFTSDDGRPFYGIAALDEDYSQDWGYALLPVERLTSQFLIGQGVGDASNYPNDPNLSGSQDQREASRVYVTALTSTTVIVDYDNDGTPDNSFSVSPLQEVDIIDSNDYNMTGAFLYTEDATPFIAVWGQDESAPVGGTSLDVGTSIVPLGSLDLDKTYNFTLDSDCTGSITPGDTVQFRIDYFNRSFTPLLDVRVTDTLDPALSYVPDSTTLNGSTAVPDDSSGTAFPLDAPGYQVAGGSNPNLTAWDSGFLTFDTIINSDGTAVNLASPSSTDLHLGHQFSSVSVSVATGADTPAMEVNNVLIDPASGVAESGETVTFRLTITNTSGVTITTLPLEETFDEDHLTFSSADPAPDGTSGGTVSWDDLTTNFGGQLLPGDSISLTVNFVANQLPSTVDTTVTATILEAERADDLAPMICEGEAAVGIAAAPPPPSRPPTGGGDRDDDASPPPSPTPTPESTPVAEALAPPPAELPVNVLPETGLWEIQAGGRSGITLILFILAGLGLTVIWYKLRR